MEHTGEDGELFNLLYNPLSPGERLDNDAIRRAILRNPDAAKRTYKRSSIAWPAYPLYMAVRCGASLDVVELMYNTHPQAIRHKPFVGYNVLHQACLFHAPLEVIRFLVNKYPEGLKETSYRRQRTPLHFSCVGNDFGIPDLGVIQFLVELYPPAFHMEDINGKTPLDFFRVHGGQRLQDDNLRDHSLQWLEEVSEPLRTVADSDSSNEQMIAVARKFCNMNWKGGVALVLVARPNLAHSLDLPLNVMPKMLSFVGSTGNLSTMHGAIRAEPDLLRCARAVRRSKRKRRTAS